MKRLGVYYRETVLSLPEDERELRNLPQCNGAIRIEKELFDWKLYAGKKFITCRSEAEARYLLVFLDAGMTQVYVPKDEQYLEKILPELERLKARTDEVVNSYLQSIVNRKLKERVRFEVYQEIMNYE
ncbi:MAG: hypothetical protein ABIK51_04465 [candidate division WOR-3 bacterium]